MVYFNEKEIKKGLKSIGQIWGDGTRIAGTDPLINLVCSIRGREKEKERYIRSKKPFCLLRVSSMKYIPTSWC